MRREADELPAYIEASGQTKPPAASKKPSRGKWLGLAVAAVIVWAGIATSIDTKPPARVPDRAELAPSPSRPAPLDSPLPAGSVEYLLADLPTASTYRPNHGALYNAARGFLEAVDATITRNRPGDYTIGLPNLAAPDLLIQISAYDSPSICYSAGSETVGVDEQIRVLCLTLVPNAFPVFTTPTDSRFTVALTHSYAHPRTLRGTPTEPSGNAEVRSNTT
jgi:hypothetical protein